MIRQLLVVRIFRFSLSNHRKTVITNLTLFIMKTLYSFSFIIILIHTGCSIFSQPIVANHESINAGEIPVWWVESAKSQFRIWYGHTSHGSQITSGMQNLQSHIGEPFTYNTSGSGGALSYQEVYGDLGHNGDLTWETLTRQQLDDPSNNRNVVVWSWCGGVSDNTPEGINIYLNAMNQLEIDYPDTKFIYMTGHLDIWSDANLKARNQQIRDYCLTNGKILFDFADIESYDPSGVYFQYANDDCSYYQGAGWGYLGNWATEFCNANPESEYCWDCYCAHSEPANCNMKGRAFWWLLARMAGWGEEQNTFFVDQNHPEASDENPGTANLPWLTIQHALDFALAGDSVVIRQGIYQESLITQNNGNETEGHIVFAGFPDEAVIIDGSVSSNNLGFRIENDYQKFYNITISNWPITGIWITGSSHTELHYLEVHDVIYGIGISGGAHDFLINATIVHHFDLYGFDASPAGDEFCYNGAFLNCVAHTGRDPEQNVDGFALGHGLQHTFVFENCTTYDVFDGFDISSLSTTINGCLAYNCWNTCYKLWQDEVELVNCIGYNGEISIVQLGWQGFQTTTTLRNCTFANAGVYTVWQANSADILEMFNCIVSGGDNIGLCFEQSSAANYYGNNNLFQNNNPARAIYVGGIAEFSIADLENGLWNLYSGQDGNSQTAATLQEIYLNPANADYHLAAFSPAIDNADPAYAPNLDFDGNIRPFGDAPDIGAYESFEQTPVYLVNPEIVNFGTVFTGTVNNQIITISNPGNVPIFIDAITIDEDVFQTSEVVFPLEIVDEFGFEVFFAPEIQGDFQGILTIISSQTYNTEIELSGTAIEEITGGFHVSGNVSGLWQTYDSIFVDDDIIVPGGQTLTIQPPPGGTDFIFTGHYKFIVYGQLQLLGNQEDSIRLYSINREEGWFGLRFYDLNYNGMDSSRVLYCSFKYGNAIGEDWDNSGGALFIYESSQVVITNCKISHNQAVDLGGGIHLRYSSPVIQKTNIINNTASAGGGICFWGSYATIDHAVICNNTASDGGGLNINGSSPVFDHVTISANQAPNGGAIYMQDWSYPVFSNSIIWGNTVVEMLVLPDGGDVVANYSDVGGEGVFYGTGNINADPLFTNPTENHFGLTWQNYPVEDDTKSPCINAGDPNYPADPDGTTTEMGAVPFEAVQNNHIPGGDVSGIWQDEQTLYIDGNIVVPLGKTLEILPVAGGTEIIFSGTYFIEVYGKLLLSGTENDSLKLFAENQAEGWRGIRFMNTDENGQGNSEISFCDFRNARKTAKSNQAGGAIFIGNSSNVIIKNSWFEDNEAVNGGAIAIFNSNPLLSNLIIAGNQASKGGGIYFENDATQQLPPATGLIYGENIFYKGAIRLPEGSGGSNWEYSGSASAYYPYGDSNGQPDGYPGSIFAMGHDWYFDIAEIDIPLPIVSPEKNPNDLNIAATLQPFTNTTNGAFDTIAYEIIRMGLEYMPAQGFQLSDKIYMCIGQHNQFQQEYSHVWINTNLNDAQMAGPWYFANEDNYRTNDYMFSIPDTWADAYFAGQKLISGRYRDGGWSGKGPNLYAFAPWQEGNPPPPEAHLQNITHLLGYSENDSLEGYKHADEWNGGAWITFDSLSAVAIVGTKALGDCWYGFSDGTPWPNDSNYIPPFPHDQRGWWADEFVARILLYDPADLVAVASGNMLPHQPQPYSHFDIDQYLFNPQHDHGRYQLGSCCYDRQNNLLYIFERIADDDKSLIHVFQISSAKANIENSESQNLSRNIRFINNWADDGGAVYVKNASPRMENAEMKGNGASAFGGAIAISGNSSPEFLNVLFTDNMAENGGAVAILPNELSPLFSNITTINNQAGTGGGAFYFDSVAAEIQNSILWQNSANTGNEIFLANSQSETLIHYCNVDGGVENFGGDGAGSYAANELYQNNINEDPLFENNSWDFRLTINSPCINAGNPLTAENHLTETDFDGNPRIWEWVVDMGCFENQDFIAPTQTILIPSGWSGLSSNLNPYFPDPETIFETEMEHLIILQNMEGFFWPEQNVNTLVQWDFNSGYLIKTTDSIMLSIPGNTILDKIIALKSGWNLIPVFSDSGLACSEILAQLQNDLVIIKEPASTNVFWPEMNIQTLMTLQPGKAYFILVLSDVELIFPENK
jgi:predicted outer membrane repeat protein